MSRRRHQLTAGRSAVVLVASSVAALLGQRSALAYPQWQFSTGATRCSACHFSPAGGGLVTQYGRDEDGDELSTFGGNGALLHGAVKLPKWIALGGDARGAFVANDVQDPSGAQSAFFPMQADVYGRVTLPKGISVYGIAGLRGQVRSDGTIIPDQNYQPVTASQLVSREHFVMWQRATLGLYARAGRFYAPFGLRLAEHILYIRRDLGFDWMRESYNLSAGYLAEQWELHLTAFAPDLLRHMGGDEWGGAALFEHHVLEDRGAVGAQAKLAVGQDMSRLIVGGVGKLYVEPLKTLFLLEGDLVRNMFDRGGVSATYQMVGLAGFSVLPVRGLVATFYGERSQSDLRVADSAWNAATGLISWFPYAHVEIQVMGRLQVPAGGVAAETLFAQLHYFL